MGKSTVNGHVQSLCYINYQRVSAVCITYATSQKIENSILKTAVGHCETFKHSGIHRNSRAKWPFWHFGRSMLPQNPPGSRSKDPCGSAGHPRPMATPPDPVASLLHHRGDFALGELMHLGAEEMSPEVMLQPGWWFRNGKSMDFLWLVYG